MIYKMGPMMNKNRPNYLKQHCQMVYKNGKMKFKMGQRGHKIRSKIEQKKGSLIYII